MVVNGSFHTTPAVSSATAAHWPAVAVSSCEERVHESETLSSKDIRIGIFAIYSVRASKGGVTLALISSLSTISVVLLLFRQLFPSSVESDETHRFPVASIFSQNKIYGF